MTRGQSRWVTVIIIALVIILRLPTLFPSLYNPDEGYYGTIANDMLDGGSMYHTAVDTKPPGMYYIYAGVFRVAGRNNLFGVHLLAIFVVVATALILRQIGARVANDWAGAWSGIGYAVFVHAYWPHDMLGANSEIFASLPLAWSVLAFLQGQKKPVLSLMFLSGALIGIATLIRQTSALNLAVILGCLAYCWIIARTQSFARVLAVGSGILIGFIAVIAALASYYHHQGNLHDAYLWSFAFAIRYAQSETTFGYVLKRLVTVHLAVILLSGLLWYFGIWQLVKTLRSFWRRQPVSPKEVLLVLWFGLSYLAIFVGWRFPGHYHLPVFSPLSILAGEKFSQFVVKERRSSRRRWRLVQAGIVAAAALPTLGFLLVAFIVRAQTLDFLPTVRQIANETKPNDRIFVWGSSPQIYSFSNRRMATRFVSCSHLVGAYASRPHEVRDSGKSVMPETWAMFQADWEAHPPVLIIDTSAVDQFWSNHPMTRYPALRAYLPGYRVEGMINGETIYRRL
jgi:hypothetical protein